ncbi:maleylpyruvate isomerase N-terminal domain-containing protein [Actinokineospora sp. HUAS TT18]|uniref:maleylpyruvate isomerase N-terminal domain-containing protein n=1 Tax=Actinokineospora sp. HUAS TT18 TaxID=3447451 RepID=UPI003F525CA1
MRSPVTADDVDTAVRLAIDALGAVTGENWDTAAGELDWTCRETLEHLADDLFFYAAQLGPRRRPATAAVRFAFTERRPGGPANLVFAAPEASHDELLQVVESCGALLTAMARTAPPDTRAHHVFGVSDPEGFAAMGVVETLVHLHDLGRTLGFAVDPPADLCDRVLRRLFRDAPLDTDRWATLLWACGRAPLGERPRQTTWRWDGTTLD